MSTTKTSTSTSATPAAPVKSSTAATLAALPVINIAPWLPSSDHKSRTGRLSTSAALHAAFLEYGFCYLDISAYIDPGEPEELTRLAREFFDRPQEEKNEIGLAKSDGTRGVFHTSSSQRIQDR
jgi:isopenicillin N synthase-like dioxygenase